MTEMTREESHEIVSNVRLKIIKRMEEAATKGQWIGFASPDVIKGLVKSLKKDPSQWWSLAPQLYSQRFISNDEAEVIVLPY